MQLSCSAARGHPPESTVARFPRLSRRVHHHEGTDQTGTRGLLPYSNSYPRPRTAEVRGSNPLRSTDRRRGAGFEPAPLVTRNWDVQHWSGKARVYESHELPRH